MNMAVANQTVQGQAARPEKRGSQGIPNAVQNQCSDAKVRSIGSAAVVGRTGDTIAGTFTTAVVAELALLELAGVGAVALLLFLLEISALSHASGVKGEMRTTTLTNGAQAGWRGIVVKGLREEMAVFHLQQAVGNIQDAGIVGHHQDATPLLTR